MHAPSDAARSLTRALAAIFALSLVACGKHAAGEAKSGAAARGYAYTDDAGIEVATLVGEGRARLGAGSQAELRATVERMRVSDDGSGAPGHVHGPAGHDPSGGVDVVSSASTTARAGGDGTLWRYEASFGARTGVGSAEAPADAGFDGRVSSEPDYLSISGALIGRVDLFDRHLALTASAGGGRDTISPEAPPPGQERDWPAHHDRVFAGAALSQVLDPKTLVTATLACAYQFGTLESPYRLVHVATSAVPERVPDGRLRLTGSISVARYLGAGFAAHVRNGAYADDWGVVAFVPEAALAWDASGAVLVDVHARWYEQSAARFYEPVYSELSAERSADARLGSLREIALGAYIEYRFRLGARADTLAASAGYDLLRLDYRELDAVVTGHLVALGLSYRP